MTEHDLYKTGDDGAPDQIKDRNGEVVLGLCKRCGRAEVELSEPCAPVPPMPPGFIAPEDWQGIPDTKVTAWVSVEEYDLLRQQIETKDQEIARLRRATEVLNMVIDFKDKIITEFTVKLKRYAND